MAKQRTRHETWLDQAEDDLLWGQDSLESEHFAQVCFIAQQVGEKALKALAFKRGFDLVKSHSIAKIAQELKLNDELARIATTLDLYYISARYPDALPDGIAPFELFNRETAVDALRDAEHIIQRVRAEVRGS